MKRYWEQLKPNERRIVAVIGLVFFIIFNLWVVTPHFSDWGNANKRMDKAHDTMERYHKEMRNKPTYEAKIKLLQSEGGSEVVEEDQAIDFVHFYNARANSNNVQVINNSRLITRTNDPFFVDHEMQLTVQGREINMVNFLYSLGAGNSSVRVRAMSLRPDPAHQQINANISIVASYAKKPPVRPTAPAAAPAKGVAAATPGTPATKPAATAPTNKPLVTMTRSNTNTNKVTPLIVKRP